MPLPWILRESEPEELNFIYATWLHSYREDSEIGRSCRKSVFFAEYPKVIDHLLSKPLTKILIACFPETSNVILSYLVYEPMTVHYLFTKQLYTKQGIAKSLFERAFQHASPSLVSYTHRTFLSEPILRNRQDQMTFNPFQLYERYLGEKKNA